MPGTGKKFDVSLVTPEGSVYEGQAEMIIVPGQIGEIGVLARHAPLIATLKAGRTRIHVGGGAEPEAAAESEADEQADEAEAETAGAPA